MRRSKELLQYLIILVVFALVWFVPLEKTRAAKPGGVPHASASCR